MTFELIELLFVQGTFLFDRSNLTPNVRGISLLCLHFLNVLLSFILAHIALRLDNIQ